ncbi:MAG: phosphatidate cytidylyltransferase [Pseudomonadota bacterium]
MNEDVNPATAPRSKDTLALRIASAAILGPAAIAASWAGGRVFAGLVGFLCVLMAFEWARMIERDDRPPVFYALGAGGAVALFLAAEGLFGFAYIAVALAGAAAAALSMKGSRNWKWAAFGAAYILAPCVALIWLRESVDAGRGLLLLLFAIVWSADTGGYVAGRLVGGPKLSPSVSPAKTWAGAVGGMIAGAIAAAIGAPLIFGDAAEGAYIAMGASLGIASILGDMTESAFKRTFGIKDMSGFIPGHGGVLDRLDGMIFATIAVTAVLYGHILAAGLRG